MKFSHSLQFNAVPEWSSKYIAYTTLKKLIYSLQRDQLRSQREDDVESSLLYTQGDQFNARQQSDPAVVFVAALDAELRKIDNFYKAQELFIFGNIEELVVDIETFENDLQNSVENNNLEGFSLTNVPSKEVGKNRIRANSDTSDNYRTQTDFETQNEDDEDEDEDEDALGSSSAALLRVQRLTAADLKHTKSIDNYLKSPRVAAVWENVDNLPPQLLLLSESRVLLRKRVIGLYTTLSELESYIELNQTGFKKACKKFDKSLNTNIKDEYLNLLSEKSYIFRPTTIEKVKDNINSLTQLYALICNHQGEEGLEIAKQELSIHLREHVVWERNTVWRDMIGLERKTYGANSSGLGGKRNARGDGDGGNEKNSGKLATSLNFTLKNPSIIKGLVIFVTFLILFNVSIFEDKQQEHCFALLIVASLLWATETIPLFVTSLLIPVIIVSCNILKNDDGSPMSAPESSKYILSTMWNSVILLLLGGFTLAAALSKYHIAKLISTWILSKAGTNPSVVLLTIMGVALFASMWVSNVAAPVLCFSLIQPLLRTLPRDSQFANALILGIALASNVGGMALPIASPQNIVAIGSMNPPPSWGQWFVIALPVCLLTLILIWIFLLTTFNCNSKNTHLVPIRVMDDRFTSVQWYISGVSIGTIFLWCIASRLEGTFGEMGIIALLPIVLFFGSGLLTTEDFNNYPWNIVVLAMGGTALGKAVASSGLLTTIAKFIQHQVADLSLFGVTLTFGLLILTMATFVSHTVAALIVIPLVSEIGNDMPEPHPNLLIMISALLCSAAMGLPTSGFPNVTAICMTDDFGKPYLTVGTFITRGVPSSIIAYIIIVSVGFTTMKLINF